ncbi:MAG: dTMP kinase [Emcibacter sp.]|nr:dTMP kinase [Emcibacter sp.]
MNEAILSRGKFISFEGGEGAGKSTQVNLLRDQLVGMGVDVVLTREPGGAPGAEEIRQLLVTGEPDKWVPMTEVLLFYAARVDHLERTVLPALAAGKWVISDRYADSTFAYQGAGHGVDKAIVQQIHQFATKNFWPDMTLILDTDTGLGLTRANAREAVLSELQREDRFEKMQEDFHGRLRQAFLDIAKENPERCRVISGAGTIGEVADRIWQQVSVTFGLSI